MVQISHRKKGMYSKYRLSVRWSQGTSHCVIKLFGFFFFFYNKHCIWKKKMRCWLVREAWESFQSCLNQMANWSRCELFSLPWWSRSHGGKTFTRLFLTRTFSLLGKGLHDVLWILLFSYGAGSLYTVVWEVMYLRSRREWMELETPLLSPQKTSGWPVVFIATIPSLLQSKLNINWPVCLVAA